jgi:23S rRNA pseudouridine1911/1915/1917 synthase
MNIPIIYEDNWLLVVDKPAGLLVIPTPKKETRTLTSILNDDLKQRGIPYRLHPCHRLDRQTSGLIIYAKGRSIQDKMLDEFRLGNIKKKYIAFLQGLLLRDESEIRIPVENKRAITEYRLIQKKKNFCVVEAMPITGRTNQLRIHFKGIRNPIVGEDKYAFRKDFSLRAKRLCLHAKELDFIHPITKKKISLKSELPQYLRDFLNNHD